MIQIKSQKNWQIKVLGMSTHFNLKQLFQEMQSVGQQ